MDMNMQHGHDLDITPETYMKHGHGQATST
jgi:hypothetical protein